MDDTEAVEKAVEYVYDILDKAINDTYVAERYGDRSEESSTFFQNVRKVLNDVREYVYEAIE